VHTSQVMCTHCTAIYTQCMLHYTTLLDVQPGVHMHIELVCAGKLQRISVWSMMYNCTSTARAAVSAITAVCLRDTAPVVHIR
jgi:hypothetical protein